MSFQFAVGTHRREDEEDDEEDDGKLHLHVEMMERSEGNATGFQFIHANNFDEGIT